MKHTLTIFTPTYNRIHTLPRTYYSLVAQTCKDFDWLIIDDGSSDGTKELVSGWIEEGKITIRYIYQENQGMHGAHNTAYRNIDTELNTCIDSDDWMPVDAVESIVSFWKVNKSDKYAGIVGLDISSAGNLIGTGLPENITSLTLRDYYEVHRGRGDKKLVYRTSVVKSYPDYPLFDGERYFGLAYKYYMIDKDYPLLILNRPLVIVEYQQDGSSYGMWRQYWNNPMGFAFFRRFDMVNTDSVKRVVMDNIHYVSHSIRSHNRSFLSESPYPFLTLLLLLPGLLLYAVNWYKVQSNSLFK